MVNPQITEDITGRINSETIVKVDTSERKYKLSSLDIEKKKIYSNERSSILSKCFEFKPKYYLSRTVRHA